MYILALDPGGTTGWRGLEVEGTNHRWGHGHLGPDIHHFSLWGLLNSTMPDVVVYESYLHSPRGKDLMAREYIGVIRLWCEMNPKVERAVQNSAEGKGFWDDDKLTKAGLWTTVKHTRDATRHLLTYLTKKNPGNQYIQMLRP